MFIKDISTSASSGLIVESVLKLAVQTGLRVVAEGIEDEETLAALRQLGCPVAQGYLIARPMPVSSLNKWINEWQLTNAGR